MKPLNKNVLVKKETQEYSGLIVGVTSDDSTQGRVMDVGSAVRDVTLNERVLLNWKNAKWVSGDLYLIHENDIVAVLENE